MMMRDDGEAPRLRQGRLVGLHAPAGRQRVHDAPEGRVGHLPPPLRAPTPLAMFEMDHHRDRRHFSLLPSPAVPASASAVTSDIVGLARCIGSTRKPVASLDWLADTPLRLAFGPAERNSTPRSRLVRDRLADETVEVGIWHGDLNPWNLITAARTAGTDRLGVRRARPPDRSGRRVISGWSASAETTPRSTRRPRWNDSSPPNGPPGTTSPN